MGYQRVDDGTDWVACAGCTIVHDGAAALGRATRIPAGGTVQAYVRGSTVRVIGSASERSIGELRVDGVATVFSVASSSLPSTLVEVDGLADEMHHVELRLSALHGLTLDAIEGIGDGAALSLGSPELEQPPLPPGGCATAPVPPAGALVLAMLCGRRRSGAAKAARAT